MKTRIGYDALRFRVELAIEKSMTRNQLLLQLRSEDIAFAERRLVELWDECNGPIRKHGHN